MIRARRSERGGTASRRGSRRALAMAVAMLVLLLSATVAMAIRLGGDCIAGPGGMTPPCWDQGQAHLDAATGLVEAWQETSDDALLAAAVEELSRSLSLRPANPFAWTSFGVVQYLRGYRTAATVALGHSLQTGPFERSLAAQQIRLAAFLWQGLGEAQRADVCRSVIWYRKVERDRFESRMASAPGRLGELVESCLAAQAP